jgi:enterochelin esterase-like enzyme
MRNIVSLAVAVFLSAGIAVADEPITLSADALIARRAQENSPVWRDGNVATFFYRGEAQRVELIFGLETKQLSRIPMSDVWTLALTLSDLERAVFSYSLLPVREADPSAQTFQSRSIWRGPKATPAIQVSAALRGDLKQFEIESTEFGGLRRATVYLPLGHNKDSQSHVIYAADGQNTAMFAQVIEPLIDERRIPPIVIVGVHSGAPTDGIPDASNTRWRIARAQEYLPTANPERFAKHEQFFCSEMQKWAEQTIGVSSDRQRRAVFGFSNGGRFAIEMGRKRPDSFGYVFAFSVAGDADGRFDRLGSPADQSQYYMASGAWEPPFNECTTRLAEELERQGINVLHVARVAGHDWAMWSEELAAATQWAFGKK